ncbi:hypothetical protein SELMODRAFT_430140 [Selaginella moellendorffii]|uniref:Uncharacterized protein n=1 Tax=Selaginella moellendorffii TaxID=88036 RepID=D8T8G7_SELML|nr:hypothetical protein SELMODRAFT_430140 [Selaginella moellendorffii]
MTICKSCLGNGRRATGGGKATLLTLHSELQRASKRQISLKDMAIGQGAEPYSMVVDLRKVKADISIPQLSAMYPKLRVEVQAGVVILELVKEEGFSRVEHISLDEELAGGVVTFLTTSDVPERETVVELKQHLAKLARNYTFLDGLLFFRWKDGRWRDAKAWALSCQHIESNSSTREVDTLPSRGVTVVEQGLVIHTQEYIGSQDKTSLYTCRLLVELGWIENIYLDREFTILAQKAWWYFYDPVIYVYGHLPPSYLCFFWVFFSKERNPTFVAARGGSEQRLLPHSINTREVISSPLANINIDWDTQTIIVRPIPSQRPPIPRPQDLYSRLKRINVVKRIGLVCTPENDLSWLVPPNLPFEQLEKALYDVIMVVDPHKLVLIYTNQRYRYNTFDLATRNRSMQPNEFNTIRQR